ncbi:MAG: hypothetical protein ACE5HE_02665 [Phycisphaerae bacterium]
MSEAVIAGTLAAVALGVRLPHKLATWICALSWHRFVAVGRRSVLSDVLIGSGPGDRSCYWLALSVIALFSGVVLALLPVSVQCAIAVHELVYARFVWAPVSVTVLYTATVFLACLVPLLVVGFAISCAHHVSCRLGQWESQATGWVIMGVGAGLVLSKTLHQLTGRADLVLVAAALPTLMVSVLCASTGSTPQETTGGAEGETPAPVPMWTDRWPTLLRASIVLVGCCGVCTMTVWAARAEVDYATVVPCVPLMLAALGAGMLGGSGAKRSGLRSIGGFGVACSAAGVMTVAATFLPMIDVAGMPSLVLPAACLSLVGFGFALGYGHQTLLHRVASRSSVAATTLWRLLLGSALVTCVFAPLLTRAFTGPSLLAMLALAQTALGGALILREPGYSRRTRRARLCCVFASLVGMCLLAPHVEQVPRMPGSVQAREVVRQTVAGVRGSASADLTLTNGR